MRATITLASTRFVWLGRSDYYHLGAILLCYLLVVIVVPPARSYPINDDWSYFRAVGRLLEGSYQVPDLAQATSFSHIAWGAVFSLIFGYDFTVVTTATLVMSVAGVMLFYLLLRHLGVSAGFALLGAAMLGFNPIYFNLSYSFMTDVTFLTCTLAASLCYVRAVQGRGDGWLWLGSMTAALSYLTRQYGILLVLAALAYLWWSHRLTWKRSLAAAIVPVATAIIYMAWEQTQPPQLVAYWTDSIRDQALRDPMGWGAQRLQTISMMLTTLGVCLLPVLRLPRRPIVVVPIFGFLAIFLLSGARSFGSVYPLTGNIVDHTGFIMGNIYTAPIWSESAWGLIGITGMIAVTLPLALCGGGAWAWMQARPWKARSGDASLMIYASGLAMAVAVLFVTPMPFDRHLLPAWAVLVLAVLKQLSSGEEGHRWNGWRWVAVAPLALFCLLAQRDYMTHTGLRWQVAEHLAAQGTSPLKIYAGFEWGGWYQYEEGARRIMERGDFTHVPYSPQAALQAALDPLYIVGNVTPEGYETVSKYPYTSWLSGGQTMNVVVSRRR